MVTPQLNSPQTRKNGRRSSEEIDRVAINLNFFAERPRRRRISLGFRGIVSPLLRLQPFLRLGGKLAKVNGVFSGTGG